jgi:integrase
MLGKISKQTVDRLPLNTMLWDSALVGFGCRRQRRSAFYLIRYRINGRQRFLTLGRHGAFTPDTARREAQRLLGIIASGSDPALAKAEDRQKLAETLGAELTRYLERKRGALKPRAYAETERHLMVHAKPLHNLPLSKIDRRAIAVRLGEIETQSGPVARNRVRSSISAFFNYAIREGLIDLNPVAMTAKVDEGNGRDRVLSETELSAILGALGQDQFSEIVRLLILTAQRREEIGSLRWSEIDWERNLIVLPPDRVKNSRLHQLPMSRQVRAILERQERRNGRDLIFGTGQGGFSGWSTSKAELDSRIELANLPMSDWRLHDLRRSAATHLGELGTLPHVIEAILNHVSGFRAGVSGIYNRARYADEMRSALQKWADYIDTLTQ